jgi:hypothetical protein
MNRVKLFFITFVGALLCSTTNALACDHYQENGGFIFLKAAFITYSSDQAILKVQVNADDYLRVKDGSSDCNLTIYVRFPNLKIKLIPFSSGMFGYESRYGRFVQITNR